VTDRILRFESVGFSYRKAPVFAGLDLEIREGEMTAVLGPNGSGKTTFVRLASGFLRPDSGAVHVSGRNLSSFPAGERARRVAVVPQETVLTFHFTVREMVRMGRAPHLGLLGVETERDFEIVREAMERSEVEHLAERSFLSLSGGERQRVILARALAQSPRLLLLDEPTAFLDLRHRLSAYRLLDGMNRENGLTVVVVSHDMNLAARHCRRLVLLDRGMIRAEGPPEEVLTPANLRDVYGVDAEVRRDPATGRPHVFPLAPTAAARKDPADA
jgi:iron complex transport system ATP-binding protein